MSASGTSIASLIPITQSPVYDSMNNKSFFVDLMTPYRDSFINDIKLPYSDLTTLSNLSTSFANLEQICLMNGTPRECSIRL